MRARRLVGSSVVVALIATALVSVGFGTPGGAQDTRLMEQRDPSPPDIQAPERGPSAVPVVGNPVALGSPVELPKSDGKPTDWFLKTDPASRAAAAASEKASKAPKLKPQLGDLEVVDDSVHLPPVAVGDQGAAKIPEASNVAPKQLNREERRAARAAAGDPVVLEGEATARTLRPAPKSPPVINVRPKDSPFGNSRAFGVDPTPPLPSGPKTTFPGSKTVTYDLTGDALSKKTLPLTSTPAGFEASNARGKIVFARSDDPDGLIQATSSSGAEIGFRPLGAQAGLTGVASGSSIQWSKLFADGSDLVETPNALGVKGEIVLSARPKSEPVWNFELILGDGLQATQNLGPVARRAVSLGTQPIGIVKENGDAVASIPPGDAIDANGKHSPVDFVLRRAAGSRWVVQLAADAAWLAAADRAYPVRVDPTYIWDFGSSPPLVVASNGPANGQYPGYQLVDDGWQEGPPLKYVYTKVAIPVSTDVLDSATLRLQMGSCWRDSYWTPGGVAVFAGPTTSLWDGWDGSNINTGPNVASDYWQAVSDDNQLLAWDMTTSVKAWMNGSVGPQSVQGFRFRMAGAANAQKMCGISNVSLEVTSHAPPPPPTTSPPPPNYPPTINSALPSDGTTNTSNQPILSVQASDPESAQLQYSFTACAPSFVAGCSGGSWSSGSQISNSWIVPVLPYLQQVQWTVSVSDGLNTVPLPAVRTFTTMNDPLLPTVTPVSPANLQTNTGVYSPVTGAVAATLTAAGSSQYPFDYNFVLYGPDGSWLAESGWQAAATWTVNVAPGTNYYWRASLLDRPTGNVPPRSAVTLLQSFMSTPRPNSPPPVPTLQSPANGVSPVVGIQTILRAVSVDVDGDLVQYQYTLCPTPGPCVTSPWVVGQWSPTLSYGTTYSWTAKARDAQFTTGDATSWTFAVGANPALAVTAPVAVAPVDGASTTTRPMLEANAGDGGTGTGVEYAFQICSPNFPEVVASPQCFKSPWVTTRYWQPPDDLNWGQPYKWRAWARNTSDSTNTIGLAGGWSRSLIPNTAAINTDAQLAMGWAPNIELDGTGDGAVNEYLGTFISTAQDAQVASVGTGLSINRTYNANSRRLGLFGRGWSSNLDIKLSLVVPDATIVGQAAWNPTAHNPVMVTLADGRREYFSQDQNGTYRNSGSGTYADLVKDPTGPGTGWRYSTPDRTSLIFDANGYLVRIEDRNGNKVTYAYTGFSVNQITDTKSGRSLALTYVNGRVDKITTVSVSTVPGSPAVLQWQYSYAGEYLEQVCPPASITATGCVIYRYANERLYKTLKPLGNTDVEVLYDTAGFATAATNLLSPGSFEDPSLPAGWVATGAAATNGPITLAGAPDASRVWSLPYGGAGTYTEALSPIVPALANTTYTVSGFVKGTSTGLVTPYFYLYDQFQTLIGSGFARDAGGESFWPTPSTSWLGIRGQFHTPENVAFVRVSFYWLASKGHNGDVFLDAVSLEKGNGFRARVKTRTDGMGNTTTYTYTPNGTNLDVLTDDPRPATAASRSTYNDKYQLVKNVDQGNRTTIFNYDANGFRDSTTDPAGNITTFLNDSRGSVKKKTFTGGGITKSEYWTYRNDVSGQPTSFPETYRDPRSASETDATYKTTYTYDVACNLTGVTDPTAKTTVYDYTVGTEAAPGGGSQPVGMLKAVTDRTTVKKTFQYSQNGDQMEATDPATGTVQMGYDEIGRLTSNTRIGTGGLPNATTTIRYDVRSRVIFVTSPAILNVVSNVNHQLQVETQRDANGNPLAVITRDLVGGDLPRTATTAFDLNDRPSSMVGMDGKTFAYGYDEAGNPTLTTDPRGLQIKTDYDERNFVTKKTAVNFQDGLGGAARSIVLQTNVPTVLGQIDTQTDTLGRVTKTSYWGDGFVKSIKRLGFQPIDGPPRDVELSYREYDLAGNSTLERIGTATTTGVSSVARKYDLRGFMYEQTVDPGGLNRVTTFGLDEEGRQKTATTGSFVSTVVYDAAARPWTSTVTGLGSQVVTYDGWGRAKAKMNGRNYTTDYVLDLADRVVTTTSPAVDVYSGVTKTSSRPSVSTGFDTYGGVTHTKDERGFLTVAQLDTSGRAKQVTYPTVGTVTPIEKFTYTPGDSVATSTDRRNYVTTFTYDSFGRRVKSTGAAVNAQVPVWLQEYDDASQLKKTTAPDGAVKVYSYDALGRQRSVGEIVRQDPTTPTYTTQMDYDDLGNVVLNIDPSLKRSTTKFNAAGQIASETDAAGTKTSYSYLPSTGWLDQVIVGDGLVNPRRTNYQYEIWGGKKKADLTNGAGTVIATDAWTFDGNGNTKTHTRPNGAIDNFVYDPLDRLMHTETMLIPGTAPTYSVVDIGFDAAGHQNYVKDPRGYETSSTYNAWGLLASAVEPATTAFPNDRTWTVGYDAGGLATSETRPGSVNVGRVFDVLGRMTSETGAGPTGPNGVASATHTFSYDLLGRVKTAGPSTALQTFGYDDRGLLRSATAASTVGGASSFTYDPVGRMSGRADVAGSLSFGYTDRGEMNAYTATPAGGQPASVSLLWNPFGEVGTVNYPGGVTRSFAYDDAGRLKDDNLVKVGQGTVARREYTYNPDSTVQSSTVTQAGNPAAGLYSYGYDLGARLTSVTGPGGIGTATYHYDLAGNRDVVNGAAYTYDQQNRVLSGGGSTYAWSARGTLMSVAGTGAAMYTYDGLDRLTAAAGALYSYDSFDRVMSRTDPARKATPASFAYGGLETDPVSDGVSSWSRSPGGMVVGQTRVGVSVLVGTERHGDVAWTLNPTSGTISDSAVSDPFGKTLGVTGTKPQLGFQGDWTDPTSGLVWMAARWYNPQTGTFLSRDTYPGSIGAAFTINRYLYGVANPLSYWDPTGHQLEDTCGGNDGFWGIADFAVDSCYNDNNGEGNTFNLNSGGNNVNGSNNATLGNGNTVKGNNNTTVGNANTVIGSGNITLGGNNRVAGDSNFTFGNHDVVTGKGNLTIGSNNAIHGSSNILFGSSVSWSGSNRFNLKDERPLDSLFASPVVRLLLGSWLTKQSNRACGAAVAALADTADAVGYQSMCAAVRKNGTAKALLKLADVEDHRIYTDVQADIAFGINAVQIMFLIGSLSGVGPGAANALGMATKPGGAGAADEGINPQGGAGTEPYGPGRPTGAKPGMTSRVADNGKGVVWQDPASTGNANSFRIADPTPQYPNGYVRFYNSGGQPIDLLGKPGPNSATHIPIAPDGTYPVPKGW